MKTTKEFNKLEKEMNERKARLGKELRDNECELTPSQVARAKKRNEKTTRQMEQKLKQEIQQLEYNAMPKEKVVLRDDMTEEQVELYYNLLCDEKVITTVETPSATYYFGNTDHIVGKTPKIFYFDTDISHWCATEMFREQYKKFNTIVTPNNTWIKRLDGRKLVIKALGTSIL